MAGFRGILRFGGALTAGLACLVVAGCLSREAADPMRLVVSDRPAPIAADAWPARDGDAMTPIVAATSGKVTLLRKTVVREDSSLVPFEIRSSYPVIAGRRAGLGAVFELGKTGPGAGPDDPHLLVFMSKQDASPSEPGVIRGTAFKVLQPLAGPPKGIVVHFNGLGGVEYEEPVALALRQHGYLVLQGEYPWDRWQTTEIDLDTEAELEAVAQRLATMVDDCQAEMAYAVEAVVEHVWHSRADLRAKPVVVLGFSAGSLVGPTVGARLGEKLAAAVLIGSGCNIMHIVQTSDLTNGGLSIQKSGRPVTGAMAGLLAGRYLAKTRLDPYHTAAHLCRTPVLLVHASSDTIVPVEAGEDLFERLCRPDRWTISGGHRTLFMQVSGLGDPIADWVDAAVARWTTRRPERAER